MSKFIAEETFARINLVSTAFEEMREIMGDSDLLEELYFSLGDFAIEEHLRYIDTCYELGVFDEDEEEDEDEDE